MQQSHSMQATNSPSDEKSSAPSLAAGYKVFVGGLSVNCKSRELRQYLEKFGEVTQCDVAGEKEGKSKGFAFATFRTKEARLSALGKNHNLKGKTFEVRELVDSSKNSELLQELSRRKLYLSNLKKSVSESELASFFSKYGKVEELTINRDVDTQESKGFGFVMFADSASIRSILGSNQSKVMKFAGSDLIVKQAIPKKEIERQKQMIAEDDYCYSEEPDMESVPRTLNEQFYNLCNTLGSNYFGHPGMYQDRPGYPAQHYDGSNHGASPDYQYYDNPSASGYQRTQLHSRQFSEYHPTSDAQIVSPPRAISTSYSPEGHMAWPVAQVAQQDYLGLAGGSERTPLLHYPSAPAARFPIHRPPSQQEPGAPFAPTRPANRLEDVWEYHQAKSRFDNIQMHAPFTEPYSEHSSHNPAGLGVGGHPSASPCGQSPASQNDQPQSLKSNSGKFETDSVETSQYTEALITPQMSGLGLVQKSDPFGWSRHVGTARAQIESESTHLWLRCDDCRAKLAPRGSRNDRSTYRSIFDFLRNKNCACQENLGRSQHISLFATFGPHLAVQTDEWRGLSTDQLSQMQSQECSQLQSREEWQAFAHKYSPQVQN